MLENVNKFADFTNLASINQVSPYAPAPTLSNFFSLSLPAPSFSFFSVTITLVISQHPHPN